jgi:very-short-patch-repair endonuclease
MASVKQAWINKYGLEEGLRMWEEHKKKFGRTKEQLIDIYGLNYYNNLKQKKNTYGLRASIDKYGEIEGLKRWNEIKSKKLNTQKENYNKKVLSDSSYKQVNGNSLEYYQNKYGVKEGMGRFLKRKRDQKYKVSKQRYIDEYGEELGNQICKKIKDNSSLQSFILRYGDIEGKLKYEENCKKCAITLDKMILKYGEELGSKKYYEWYLKISSVTNTKGYSKISQELFWSIYNNLLEEQRKYCKFYELNEEEKFYFWQDKKCFLYRVDFKYKNLIIEFNGRYWHKIKFDLTDKDMLRKANLESIGYKVIVITDDEYEKNKELIVTNILNEIKQL